MNIRVSVPAYRKIENEDEKSHTVFCIQVYVSGHHHTVEKRYSQFDELHKKLKQIVPTPNLPPKTVLKWSHKVVEHRRQRLEAYLQGVLEGGKVPRCMLRFLNISNLGNGGSMESLDKLEEGRQHQCVMAFAEDAFLHDQIRGGLPDTVVYGVHQGLYGSADDLR